jgi:glycosyltransferase involved in cell wall biosynthesis
MENYKTEHKDYSKYAVIMISTDQHIFDNDSSVRARMVGYSKLYKELHIIIFSSKQLDPIKISDNLTIYSTKSFIRINYVSDAQKIGKKIIKKIDKESQLLVSCQNPFETGLVGKCLANLRIDSELLLQIHTDLYSPYFCSSKIGLLHSILNRINLFISNFTLQHAQVIQVVSRKIADSLVQRGVDIDKIIVKPISVDFDYIKSTQPSFNLKQKYPQFKKIVLVVSRLESEKNISLAIESMKIVNESISDVGLIVVGSGSKLITLEKQAQKLKIGHLVDFVGWKKDTIPYYKGCDVFLMTSWYEGYGMVLKEAEAAGCKIVSTDVGIAREVGASLVDWEARNIAKALVNFLK